MKTKYCCECGEPIGRFAQIGALRADIEKRLADHDHAVAIEWVKMQDERIAQLEAALKPFAGANVGQRLDLALVDFVTYSENGVGRAGSCTIADFRRATKVMKDEPK